MLTKLIRIFSIFLLISGLFWWGDKYGPRSAIADVYRIQKLDSSSPLSQLKTMSHPMGKRSTILNGSQSNVTLAYSEQSVLSIMKHLESSIENKLIQADDSSDLDQQLIQALTRPYRVIGKNSAMFIHLIQDIQPGKGLEVFKRLTNKKPFGEYAKLGYSIVLNQAENGRTAIWTTKFKSDKDFFIFLENNVKETSGNDILDIQRFPGSHRILSFAENTQIGQGYINVYEGKGSFIEHIQHYKTLLSKLGLKERTEFKSESKTILNFYKENYEITVFISQSEDKQNKIMDFIELSIKS